MKRLYLMITITNRVVGSGRFVDFYRAFGAPVVFTALGRGTASDDVLSYLGLEATEKAVLFSVVTPACKETLVKELVSTMHLTAPGSGIAVCLPLSSIGGKSAMNYLTSGDPSKAPEIDIEEDHTMKEAAYQLIVAIANQGLVKVHSGYPGQARNRPNRPDLTTMFRPHTSHFSSVTSSGTFRYTPSMSFSTWRRLPSKPP